MMNLSNRRPELRLRDGPGRRVFGLATWGLALLYCAACGTDTGRERVFFDLRIGGVAEETMTTSAGYDVQLTEAHLSLQRVEFFEGEPLFSLRSSERWSRWLGIRTAHAHPGHFQEGEALADALQPVVVDLLGSAPATIPGDGVTGSYRSARIAIAPDASLDGNSVVVEGTASRGSEVFEFRGRLAIEESVTGIAVGYEVDTDRGEFQMEVDLERWFDRIEFDELGTSVDMTPDGQPHNALLRGIRNTSAYRFVFEEGE